ncbi:MAG: hypothetical protein R3D58_04825 [Saprospiraceae bacterium]
MTKKKSKGGKKLTAKNLQIELLKFLLSQPKKQFAPRQLTGFLNIENNKDSVEYALNQLVVAGSVKSYKDGRYGIALERLTVDEPAAEKMPKVSAKKADKKAAPKQKTTAKPEKVIEGRVDMTRSGAAYIVTDSMENDVYVAPRYLNSALNGDIVRVLLFPTAYRGRKQKERKPEGEVLQVLKRSNEFFIGTLRKSRKYVPCSCSTTQYARGYTSRSKVVPTPRMAKKVVRVTDWQEGKGRVPIGAVTQTLGAVGGTDFEMKKISSMPASVSSIRKRHWNKPTIPERIPGTGTPGAGISGTS